MEDRATHWPAITEEQARLLTYTPYQSPDKPKGMSQSQSEANIAYLGGQSPGEYPSSRDSSTLHDSADLSPTRGRSKSPVKYHLDDIREDVVVEVPQSVGKRSRSPMKKMFGENGWLGRSTSLREMPDEQYRKTGLKHWGGKIKQRVEGLTEDMTKLLPNPFGNEVPERSPTQSKFPISLTPPAQSKLYSEIELMICVTANTYLMGQRREGRMSVESLLKITEFWKSKGRPQVIEFQYDQATQRDLVLYNIKTFRFFGQHAENSISINSMLYNWKSLAKEMSVRTFCTPDSVIRKHLHDIYKILELLGAPLTTFLAFQEIQVKALKTIRDEQMMRAEKAQIQYGVERAWYPPASASANPDGASHIDLNAFEG
ncbi:MAG: hypothetical protein M1832_003615 [Thelocarpon impressellum]|nr:MAG: hypothetical protein M1832_003615 [Thelocarpon impressellum]